MRSFLALSLILALPALSPAEEKKSALDKKAFADYIRQVELLPQTMELIVGDPEPSSVFPDLMEIPVEVVTPNGNAAVRYFASKDGQRVIKGNVFDINKNPFAVEMAKLKTDLQPSYGTPGAPVVLVVFSDFQCPSCRDEAKILRENLVKAFPKEVRVYFKDYPLEKLHPWAKSASIAGRCIFRQNPALFWDYHDWIYEGQKEILPDNLKTKILGWADTKNLDTAKLTQCIDTKATEKEVERQMAEGRALQVRGTPTLFINGRPIHGGLAWGQLEQVIRQEVGYQQTANNAGEKCCEVSIPTLVPAKK